MNYYQQVHAVISSEYFTNLSSDKRAFRYTFGELNQALCTQIHEGLLVHDVAVVIFAFLHFILAPFVFLFLQSENCTNRKKKKIIIGKEITIKARKQSRNK
jgi:hypothetical protein